MPRHQITDWKTIKTAPRHEGEAVLLVVDGQVKAGWWFQADPEALEGGRDAISGWYACQRFEEPSRVKPTHWMPMPPPPSIRKRDMTIPHAGVVVALAGLVTGAFAPILRTLDWYY
jgi:hypothetical protein